jgi:hypothetical protein
MNEPDDPGSANYEANGLGSCERQMREAFKSEKA